MPCVTPSSRYCHKPGYLVLTISGDSAQSSKKRSRGTLGKPSSSASMMGLSKYRELGKSGLKQCLGMEYSCMVASSTMKNSFAPVAMPRLTSKIPPRVTPDVVTPSSESCLRIHFCSKAASRVEIETLFRG